MLDRILKTTEDRSILLIRLLVGAVVFVPEGIQELLFPAILGAGHMDFGFMALFRYV